MSGAARQKSLADVLVDAGLCTIEQVQYARRREGMDLISALVADGVGVEDRLIRSLSGVLGLEVVGLEGLQVHDRVLGLVPPELAIRALALPIAMKRSGETDFLYMSMADPLDHAMRTELQKAAGCQLVVVLAAPSQLRTEVERHYGGRARKARSAQRIPASLPSDSPPPPPLPRRENNAPPESAPVARAPARALSSPGGMAAHLRSGEQWEVRSDAPKQIHLYDHRTGDIVGSESRSGEVRASVGPVTPVPLMPGAGSPLPVLAVGVDPRDDLRDAIIRSGEHPRVLEAPPAPEPPTERPAAPVSKSGLSAPSIPAPKLPAFRLDNLPVVPGQNDIASRFSPTPGMTEPTARLSPPGLPVAQPTVQDADFAATVLDMPIAAAMGLPSIDEADIQIHDDGETTAEEEDAVDRRAVAHALELPVPITDAPSPFDDLKDVRHRPGLEKTGVIPLAELLREEFNPKQLNSAPAENLLGTGDIPESPAEARARAVPLVSVSPPLGVAPIVVAPPAPLAPPPAPPAALPIESVTTRVVPEAEDPSLELEPTRRVPKPPRRTEPPRADSQPVFQSLLETEPEATDRKSVPSPSKPDTPSGELRSLEPRVSAVPGGEPSNYEELMVQRLLAGESLTSADRARLVLAIGRLLVGRGVLSKQELVAILRDAR